MKKNPENYEKEHLFYERETYPGSQQYVWRFPNDYGASLIRGGMAYGGLELAVLKFGGKSNKFNLCYDTPITDDVIGHMEERDILPLLKRIKALRKRKP